MFFQKPHLSRTPGGAGSHLLDLRPLVTLMHPGHGEGADVEGKVWRRRQRALNELACGEQSTLLFPGKATFSLLELEIRVCYGLYDNNGQT